MICSLALLAATPVLTPQSTDWVWHTNVPTSIPNARVSAIVPAADGAYWAILETRTWDGAPGDTAFRFVDEDGVVGAPIAGPDHSSSRVRSGIYCADGAGGFFHAYTLLPGANRYLPEIGEEDLAVERYDASGQLLWGMRLGGTENDNANGITAAPGGEALICGSTAPTGGFGGSSTVGSGVVVRVSGTGAMLNAQRVEGDSSGAPESTYLTHVTLDPSGEVFVAGLRTDTPASGIAAIGARLDAGLQPIWVEDLPSSGVNTGFSVLGIESDGVGGMLVMGEYYPGVPSVETAVARLDATGAFDWFQYFNAPMTRFDRGAMVRVGSNEFVVALDGTLINFFENPGQTSTPWLATLDRTGVTQMERGRAYLPIRSSSTESAAIDSRGSLIVGATFLGPQFSTPPAPWTARYDLNPVGSATGCGATVNSTGLSATLQIAGSDVVAANDVALYANHTPEAAFGFFLASRAQGNQSPPTSAGTLCLGGSIGRFVGPGQIQSSDLYGGMDLRVDLNAIPQPNGSVAGVAGETWYFQTWFRDLPSAGNSNFSESVSVVLQ